MLWITWIRSLFSVSVFNNSTLWITGGEDGANYLKSTEFVFVNQPPIEGPDLPFAISGHCMVQVDARTIFIVGGSLSTSKSSPVNSKKFIKIYSTSFLSFDWKRDFYSSNEIRKVQKEHFNIVCQNLNGL